VISLFTEVPLVGQSAISLRKRGEGEKIEEKDEDFRRSERRGGKWEHNRK
jgi:hypothetical protein